MISRNDTGERKWRRGYIEREEQAWSQSKSTTHVPWEVGRRGQRLMGRYIPAAERGWIDVGITGISIIWHMERYASTRGRRSFRFYKIAFEGSRPECFCGSTAWARTTSRGTVLLPIPVTLTLTMKRARVASTRKRERERGECGRHCYEINASNEIPLFLMFNA